MDFPRRRGPYLPSHSGHKNKDRSPLAGGSSPKALPEYSPQRRVNTARPSPASLPQSLPTSGLTPKSEPGSPPPPLRTARPARGGTEPAWLPAPPPPAHLARGGPGRPRRRSLLPRLTHLEGAGGGREAAEPRDPGVGRSRGWSVALAGARGDGGFWGGTDSRLGRSRGLSEPARPRDRPKISDTFSPKPHTDSAGGDTENIFFLFLPPHPPTSLPARLPPPPPALAPPYPAACPCPAPSSVPWGWGAGDWAGRSGTPGSLPLPFAGLPWLRPREAGQGWQKRSVSWAHDATLSLWHFPPSCHLRRGAGGGYWLSPLAGLWFPEASLCTSSGQAVRAVSTSSQGWLDRAGIRQSRSHYLHPALSLYLRVKVDSSSPCLPQPVLRSQEQTGLTSGGCRGSEALLRTDL